MASVVIAFIGHIHGPRLALKSTSKHKDLPSSAQTENDIGDPGRG